MSQYQNDGYSVPPQRKSGGGLGTGIILVLCLGGGCAILFVIIVLIAILLPAVQAGRDTARRMQCTNQEKQIVIALHIYHDVHGTFPPAYTTDEDGNPLHSWRVMILPYMEQQELYDSINLDEPWDSTHNSVFHSQIPSVYLCPSAPASSKITGLTSYKWVIGENTISNGPDATDLSEVTRVSSNAIAIIEVIPSTNWMAPEDIQETDLISNGINYSRNEGAGSYHRDGINVGMMDGSIKFVSDSVEEQVLSDMIHIRDETAE